MSLTPVECQGDAHPLLLIPPGRKGGGQYKMTSAKLRYLSLLTDIVGGKEEVESIRERRDALQASLAAIYKGAPHTDGKAYGEAQKALQRDEDYTFSDEEIDKFLPRSLRVAERAIERDTKRST
jgi:hypothetical protein